MGPRENIRKTKAGVGVCLHALIYDRGVACTLEEDGEQRASHPSTDDTDSGWGHCENSMGKQGWVEQARHALVRW